MFKHLNALFIGLALFACTSGAVAQTIKPIETPVPVRPAGQKDVVGLTAPKLDVVRVGFIGLGMRGPGAVERFTHIPGTQIVALCDLIPERVAGAQKILTNASLPEAASYSGSEDAWKNFANVTISTSFTSRLTGNITHRWLSTPWNTASTLPSKFLRQ